MKKVELINLNEVIKLPLSKDVDINESYVDNLDGTVNFMINKDSLQKAIDEFIKNGNVYKGGYPVWLYDTMLTTSSFIHPVNDGEILGEVISFDINDNILIANIDPISEDLWDKNDKLKTQLSFDPTYDYNRKELGFRRINGVIKVLTINDLELEKGGRVLLISKKGIEEQVIEDIEVEIIKDEERVRYKVKGFWFGSDGLLVSGRGMRIKHLNGETI